MGNAGLTLRLLQRRHRISVDDPEELVIGHQLVKRRHWRPAELLKTVPPVAHTKFD
jgi:hypothetical protein